MTTTYRTVGCREATEIRKSSIDFALQQHTSIDLLCRPTLWPQNAVFFHFSAATNGDQLPMATGEL